jgi:hypothetical protein
MPLFAKPKPKAQISVPEPVKVQAGAVGGYNSNMAGPNMIGARNRAMQVPAVSRARDLHASVISAMPLTMYRETWNDTTREMDDEYCAAVVAASTRSVNPV